MKGPILEDTTLRDGEQSPGVAFNEAIKLNILDLLIKAGVSWIEIGIPVMGGRELKAIKAMLERKYNAALVGWNRGIKKDIKQSIDLGFKYIHIGLPASDIHLKDSVKKDRNWLLAQSADLIKYAKDRDVFVSVSAEDVGRTELNFLKQYANHVRECGADRLRLSDTIGILSPEKYSNIFSEIKKDCDIDLHSHAHNDFGFAVANTIAALKAGARYFHVTVNGIGERAGMADIAQVAFALKHLYGADLGIDGAALMELSQYVGSVTKPTPPWCPIVGENVFSHESGIHVNGMLRNKLAFEAILPEELGRESKFILGKHSGRSTIEFHLNQHEIIPSSQQLDMLLEWLRDESMNRLGSVSPADLIDYYNSQFSNKATESQKEVENDSIS